MLKTFKMFTLDEKVHVRNADWGSYSGSYYLDLCGGFTLIGKLDGSYEKVGWDALFVVNG